MREGFFKPKAVAVVGASRDEGRVGFRITMNLIWGRFPGSIQPVNPKASQILGVTSYADVKDLPADADLAVRVIPPRACLPTLEACTARGMRSAIVLPAGFKAACQERTRRSHVGGRAEPFRVSSDLGGWRPEGS